VPRLDENSGSAPANNAQPCCPLTTQLPNLWSSLQAVHDLQIFTFYLIIVDTVLQLATFYELVLLYAFGAILINSVAEKCLNSLGTDIASGPVWMEYIAFLKSMPVCVHSVLSFFFIYIVPYTFNHVLNCFSFVNKSISFVCLKYL